VRRGGSGGCASDCGVRGPRFASHRATSAAMCNLGHGLRTFTAVPRSTQPCIRPGSLNRVLGWDKGGNVTCAGWHVILCDPMWHVSFCSMAGLHLHYPCKLLRRVYLLNFCSEFFFCFGAHWGLCGRMGATPHTHKQCWSCLQLSIIGLKPTC